MRIYGAPGTALMAPHAILEEVGADYEWHHVDLKTGGNRTAEFLALNPKGRVPVLVDENKPDGNPWGVQFSTMFHMSNDSHLFRTREELEAEGFVLQGNVFVRPDEPGSA